ncbi:MAG: methyltransferase domain-containing protein [Gemmatimonadota bacterium]
MVVITSENRDVIIDAVRGMYSHLARQPQDEFHFATGRFACEYVGYSADELDPIPPGALESFAGVAHPFIADVIRPGQTVLDVGSGSGTDALIASRIVGLEGEVIGLDMTSAMREKLERNAREMGATNVRTLDGNAEEIPLPDTSVDVVTSNGVLNLVPDKESAIREIYRVLRPGGKIQISDIVVEIPPSEACRAKPELWAECIVGAVTKDQYLETLAKAGFEDLEILQRVDYFSASPSDETKKVASGFNAHAIVITGVKPA